MSLGLSVRQKATRGEDLKSLRTLGTGALRDETINGCIILSLSLSLTAYPNGRRIFDRTAETTSVSAHAHRPASIIELSKAPRMPLPHCLLGLPLSLFPSNFPFKMIFPSPRFFSDDQN